MVKKLFVLVFTLLCTPVLQAQYCGTKTSKKQSNYLEKQRPSLQSFDATVTRGIHDLPIKIHIVSSVDKDQSFLVGEIKAGIENLNSHFINANIRFIPLEKINFIVDTTYCNMDYSKEMEFCPKYDVTNVVNLYVTEKINGGSIAGYTSLPPGPDRVLIASPYINESSTLVHEMGHYFSLYHTHGKTNFSSTDELVNGENCKVAGDEICDTPADPNMYELVGSSCKYTGKARDENNELYQPKTDNFMSYSLTNCRTKFTPQQYKRITFALLKERSHLVFPTASSQEEVKIAELGGELIFSIAGQGMQADLDANMYKMKESYYSGTNYQLHINTNQAAYVYVFSTDKTKKSNLLFPMPQQDPFISGPKNAIALPDKLHMFQLDNTIGKDYIYVLYSSEPLVPQKIMKHMESESGTFMQRLYKVLGEEVVQANQITYTNNGALRFTAQPINNQTAIVPIVVEIDHQ